MAYHTNGYHEVCIVYRVNGFAMGVNANLLKTDTA